MIDIITPYSREYTLRKKHTNPRPSKYINYFTTGQRIGKRTILDPTLVNKRYGNSEYETPHVLTRCDCGKELYASVYNLVKGRGSSCGLCWNGKLSNNIAWKGCGSIPGRYFNNLKRNAEKRNLEFDITIEYLHTLYLNQNGKCALCGDEIYFSEARKYTMDTSASLDRIDNDKGYVKGNVQFVSKKLNFAKHKSSNKEFIEMCKKVADKHRDMYD